ncbi:MAG: hypothetical protein WAX33_10665 [Rectinemataceae bacterium]
MCGFCAAFSVLVQGVAAQGPGGSLEISCEGEKPILAASVGFPLLDVARLRVDATWLDGAILPSLVAETKKDGLWLLAGKGTAGAGKAYRKNAFTDLNVGSGGKPASLERDSVSRPWIVAVGSKHCSLFCAASSFSGPEPVEIGTETVFTRGPVTLSGALSFARVSAEIAGSGWMPDRMASPADSLFWSALAAGYGGENLRIGFWAADSIARFRPPGLAAAASLAWSGGTSRFSWAFDAGIRMADGAYLNPGGARPELFSAATAGISFEAGSFGLALGAKTEKDASPEPIPASCLRNSSPRIPFSVPCLVDPLSIDRVICNVGLRYGFASGTGVRAMDGKSGANTVHRTECGIKATILAEGCGRPEVDVDATVSGPTRGKIETSKGSLSFKWNSDAASVRTGISALRFRLVFGFGAGTSLNAAISLASLADPEEPFVLDIGIRRSFDLGGGFSMILAAASPGEGRRLEKSSGFTWPDASLVVSFAGEPRP